MFVVVYSFKVKEGQETEFEEAWYELTELVYVHSGSLGARLHTTKIGDFVAYTQWPNRETWKTALDKIPKKSQPIRRQIRNCCRDIQTTLEMDVQTDLLMPRAFSVV